MRDRDTSCGGVDLLAVRQACRGGVLAGIWRTMVHFRSLEAGCSDMRLILKSVRFALIFFVIAPILFGVRFLVWPVAWYSPRLDRRIRRFLLWSWTAFFRRIAGIKVVTQGTPPKPPCFIVANHLSYIDMLMLTYLTECIYVSRGDVEHWPVIGFMSKAMYVIFIDRTNKRDTKRVNVLIEEALEQGDGIAVFAESRISSGFDVEPFKSALIEPAVANKLPVHYATITYETAPGMPPASQIVGWWRPEPFFYHLFRLLGYRGFTARVIFGDAPISGDNRKELAGKLWKAVRANYVPIK